MRRFQFCHRLISVVLAFLLAFSASMGYAQSAVVFALPRPGMMVALSQPFNEALLRGIKVYPDDPLRLDFVLDKGDVGKREEGRGKIEEESRLLVRYFLAALTIPDKDLWVNLSPYEKDRVVPEAFGQTEMGRDLLAQDYMLKQVMASIIHPDGEVGKKFWAEIYKKARERSGSTVVDIPMDTFNKVWIVPGKAEVFEKGNAVYVTQARLKVMLDMDHLANVVIPAIPHLFAVRNDVQAVLCDIVIPVIEKEVNEGKNFARLRQVYHSLVLATWYRKKITASLLSRAYVGQKKVQGVNGDDPDVARKIWARYVESFKKGAYDFIREDYDPATQASIPRKYFSGGMSLSGQAMGVVFKVTSSASDLPSGNNLAVASCRLGVLPKAGDAAMDAVPVEQWYGVYVKAQLEKLPSTEAGSLIRDSWQDALSDPGNIVLHSVTRLAQLGVSEPILKQLIHSLIGSGIDVTDSWGTIAQIWVFLDISPQWFGEDLSGYADKLSSEVPPADLHREPALPLDEIALNPGASLREIRSAYRSFMKYRRSRILAAGDFHDITARVGVEADEFMKRLLGVVLGRIFREFGVSPDSEYFIYFREFKTFASDGDIFYIGPRQEEVLVRLMQVLNLLGVNMDDDSGFAIRQHVAKKDPLDMDVLGFFYNGNVLEQPAGSFAGYFAEKIMKNGLVDMSWEMMHPYVARMLKIWSMGLGPEDKGEFERTDFKKVLFRPVMILLFGLAAKFKLRGYEVRGELMKGLERYLSDDEVNTLGTALAFANHSRSLYQITSGDRNRSKLRVADIDFIRRVMAEQGVQDYDGFMIELGRKVEAIREKYFGNDMTMGMTIPWMTNKIASISEDDRPARMLGAVLAENGFSRVSEASVLSVGHETLMDHNFFGFDVVEIYREFLADDGVMDLTEEIWRRTYEALHGPEGAAFARDFFLKLRALKKQAAEGSLSTEQLKAAFLELQQMSRERALGTKYAGDARREFFRKGVEQVSAEHWKGYIVDLGADDNMLGDVLLQVHGGQIEHIEGVDIEERTAVRKGPKLGFSLSTEETFAALAGKADAVVVRYALHHMTWQQQEDYLAKIRRMLKPGGKIIIYEDTFSLALTPEAEGPEHLHEKVLALQAPYRQRLLLAVLDTISIGIRDKHQPFPFTFRTAEEWAGFFQNMGYKVLEERYFGILTHDFFKAPLTTFVLTDDPLARKEKKPEVPRAQTLEFRAALTDKLASAGVHELEDLLVVGAAYGKGKEEVLEEIQEIGRRKLIFSPDGKWDSFFFERDPETGNATGRVVSYKAAHENGLWHAGTYVLFLTEEGNAIVQLRRDFGRYDVTAGGAQELTWDARMTGYYEAEEELHLQAAGLEIGADRFTIVEDRVGGKPFFRKVEGRGLPEKSGYDQAGVFHVREAELTDNREIDTVAVVRLNKTEELSLLEYFRSHETDEVKKLEVVPLLELISRVGREPEKFASGLRLLFEDPVRRQDVLSQIDASQSADKGGIDLTPEGMNVKTSGSGEGIEFRFGAAQLERMQNAAGVMPVIMNIRSIESPQQFLGIGGKG